MRRKARRTRPKANRDDAEGEPNAADTKADPHVKLDDGTELKLSELAAGYQRQQDYTRKTQELAHHRKEFEASAARFGEQASQREKQLNEAFEDLCKVLPSVMPREPDLSLLHNRSDGLYAAEGAIYDASLKQIEAVFGAQKAARARAGGGRRTAARRHHAVRDAEGERNLPVAADRGEKGKAFLEGGLRGCQSLGYTHEELSAIDDHRQVRAARGACAVSCAGAGQGRQRQAASGRQAGLRPPKAPSASVRTRQPAAPSSKALRSFRETGSVRDAERAGRPWTSDKEPIPCPRSLAPSTPTPPAATRRMCVT